MLRSGRDALSSRLRDRADKRGEDVVSLWPRRKNVHVHAKTVAASRLSGVTSFTNFPRPPRYPPSAPSLCRHSQRAGCAFIVLFTSFHVSFSTFRRPLLVFLQFITPSSRCGILTYELLALYRVSFPSSLALPFPLLCPPPLD